MPAYGWFSKKSVETEGSAIYSRPDGSEVEVSYVAWGVDELSANPGDFAEWDDLVFVGEVVKILRLGAGAEEEEPQNPYSDLLPEDFIDPGDFE